MTKLFLYGNTTQNFKEVFKPFVEASGGRNAEIVFCHVGAPGWEKYYDGFLSICREFNIAKVDSIKPVENSTELSEQSLELVRNSTGIFITGGSLESYWKTYVDTPVSEIIKEKYRTGTPYAGVSEGAMIAMEKWSDYEETAVSDLYSSMGLLKNTILVPHFTECKWFDWMMKDMNSIKSSYGLGIDEPTCVEVTDEKQLKVHGAGNLYLFKRKADFQYSLKVMSSGETEVLTTTVN